MQPRSPLTDEQMRKLWYVHTVVYSSVINRNGFELAEQRQTNLEPIVQNEVSQKERNKYCILMCIYGIQKNGTDEPVCRAGIETQTQRTDLWAQQEKRVEQTKRVTLTYIWRRKWQPTPIFLLGASHRQRSLAGHGPQGHRESDTTEATNHALTYIHYHT